MNCANCGTSNLDNATLCINCGRPLTAAAAPPPPPRPVSQTYIPPPSASGFGTPAQAPQPPGVGATIFYLLGSIGMLFCCCDPVAILSLIFAINTMSRRSARDFEGTARNARLTAIWFWIAFVVAVAGWGLLIGIRGWDVFEEIRRGLPT